MIKTIAFGFVTAVLLLSLASGGFSQGDPVESRIKLMKSNSADNKALKAAVAKEDFATVATKAKHIAENMGKLADLFPKGSTSDKSRAKPEIWEKWDDFKARAASAKSAATELAEAAAAKDGAKVGEKFVAFGKTCGECHKPYRAPRN